jgi:hypothetical protein
VISNRLYIEILKCNLIKLRAIKQPVPSKLVKVGNPLISLLIDKSSPLTFDSLVLRRGTIRPGFLELYLRFLYTTKGKLSGGK